MLMQSALNGDRDATNEVLARAREILETTARGSVDNGLRRKVGPSDLIQQTLVEAYEHLGTFRGTTVGEFRSWLATMFKHNLIDADRRYRHSQQRDISLEVPLESNTPLPGSDPTPSSIARAIESDTELWNAISSLPERERTIIVLRHRDQLSHAEIAARLKMNEAAVRKQWGRTVERLRRMLMDEETTS